MLRQTYILVLEAPPAYDRYFPRVEAERMADIIRDAIQHESRSFVGPVPFTITVERTGDAATVAGELPDHAPETFPVDYALEQPLVSQGLLVSPEIWLAGQDG